MDELVRVEKAIKGHQVKWVSAPFGVHRAIPHRTGITKLNQSPGQSLLLRGVLKVLYFGVPQAVHLPSSSF